MRVRAWLALTGCSVLVACGGVSVLGSGPGGASSGGAGSGEVNNAGTGGSASSGGSATIVASAGSGNGNQVVAPDCVVAFFGLKCSGQVCHTPGGSSFMSPDLTSPNVAARLVDVPAVHPGIPPGAVCPTGDKLIDTTNRSESWLSKKVLGPVGAIGECGTAMPQVGTATADELSCLQNWIDTVPPIH
jgi:hypothetical protein